jgi:hypothetical protein
MQLACQTGFPAFSSDSSGFRFLPSFSGGVFYAGRSKALIENPGGNFA